ncbi:MAG: N-acetylmuramoyl-L-alanine amidase [Ruminococcaceae bacterium]|nr:N-acetylmuramoyl-L-alanine amidase [Oscillospiraceae bacterium]
MSKKYGSESRRRYLRIISCLLFGVLSLFFVSCSSVETGEEAGRDVPVSVDPAEPSDGVGRVMPEPITPKTFTVCIDPGHGFLDGGCGDGYFENGILEKDITLSIAKKLNEALTELGFNTIMTHDGVTFPKTAVDDGNNLFKPQERVSYANSLDIDYYVSIHVNSYPQDTSVTGLRIYYEQNWRKENTYSETIATSIGKEIYKAIPDGKEPVICNQDVASYAVVRETKAAASLIEVGFCTNPTEAQQMLNYEWQGKVVEGISNGILEFYNVYVKGEGNA